MLACGVVWGVGRRTDVTQLLPTSTMAVDMVPNSVGQWMLHCHVSAHMMRGMIAVVHARPPKFAQTRPPFLANWRRTGTQALVRARLA